MSATGAAVAGTGVGVGVAVGVGVWLGLDVAFAGVAVAVATTEAETELSGWEHAAMARKPAIVTSCLHCLGVGNPGIWRSHPAQPGCLPPTRVPLPLVTYQSTQQGGCLALAYRQTKGGRGYPSKGSAGTGSTAPRRAGITG